MKYLLLVMIVLLVAVNHSQAQKKLPFEYPTDSVSETSKKAFTKKFNQGKTLYMITCSKCHNVKDGRKDVIPDFSLPQLMDYEMRFAYPEHMERLNDTKITDEEMNSIIIFLRYKEKSGRPIHP